MSKLSLKLQTKSLKDMETREVFHKNLAGIEYIVLPRVYKGSTDTELMCSSLKIGENFDVWDIGTGTGLIALTAKKLGAKYVLASDYNIDAVNNTRENSKVLKLDIDIQHINLFGSIKKKFDLITFNPPFTDNKAVKSHEISFWDNDHLTVKRFFKDLHNYLKPNGKSLICWSSFAKVNTIKSIASNYGYKLNEIRKRKGKMNFIYYVFEVVKL